MQSTVYDAPAPPRPDPTTDGFVNLIWNGWKPSTPDPIGDAEDPIEGCTLHDVGWMRVAYQDVIVGMYYYVRDVNSWYAEYRRPPEVATA